MDNNRSNNGTQKISCTDVADYFLALANDTGDILTNLKLQKLVYYAQAWYLANYKKPIFEEDFQAWVHGPAIPVLYREYKEFGFSPISKEVKPSDVKIDDRVKAFLAEVAKVYMPYGAFELEEMTHKEKPWIDARGGCEADQNCEEIIPKSSMRDYYGQKIS